jgi:hypothetical protein
MRDPERPRRSLCIAVDLTGYSTRYGPDQEFAQHAMAVTLRHAYARAGLDRSRLPIQPRGDGELALLPSDIDEPTVIADLIHGHHDALQHTNRHLQQQSRLRLRLAIHQGLAWRGQTGFLGEAVVTVCRLVDSAELRQALTTRPRADLAVIVSHDIYHSVIEHNFPHGIPAAAFTPITIHIPDKNFHHRAWIQVEV